MKNKEQLLRKLIKRNEELKPIVFKGAKNDTELDRYIKGIQKEFDEYYDNQEKIEHLEWELMTPEEQKTEKESIEKMKLKRDGKL